MPTISKTLAEREIKRLKKQKKPKAYCIVRYQNRLKGDSKKASYSDYAICYKPSHYQALMESNFVGGIDILWASERFVKDQQDQLDEDVLAEFVVVL